MASKKHGFLPWKIDSSPRPRDVLASIAHQTFHSAFLLFGTGWQRDLMLSFLVRSVSRVIELHWRLSKARFCWSFVELCVTMWTWIYGGKLFLELDLGLSCASVVFRPSSWAASWRHMQSTTGVEKRGQWVCNWSCEHVQQGLHRRIPRLWQLGVDTFPQFQFCISIVKLLKI